MFQWIFFRCKIDIVFFNSREGYIKAVLPLNNWVLISGKINYYKNKHQITNPEYITSVDKVDYIKKKNTKILFNRRIK